MHVFNPQGIGGVASTFRWSPLQGCENPSTAIRRADAITQAVSLEGTEDASFWTAKASSWMRGMFHAAALAGTDMRTVVRWALGDASEAEQILAGNDAPQWAAELAEMHSRGAEDRRDSPDGAVPRAGVHDRPAAGRVGAARARRAFSHP